MLKLSRKTNLLAALIFGFWIAQASLLSAQQPTRKAVKRVKRPVFDTNNQSDPFFENLFEEGLVGARPEKVELPAEGANTSDGRVAGGSAADGADWASSVSAETIENEVKRLQQKLVPSLSNPVVFKTKHSEVREAFSLLSTMFGIISEFENDIRWKEASPAMQIACAQAAVAAREPGLPAFNACKRRAEDLAGLIRGSRFSGEVPDEPLDWGSAADRSDLMVRLEESFSLLKESTAQEGTFKKNVDAVAHESELVAGIAKVLIQADVPDAESEEYVALSEQMATAARDCKKACEQQNHELASEAVNMLGKSCSECHEQWR